VQSGRVAAGITPAWQKRAIVPRFLIAWGLSIVAAEIVEDLRPALARCQQIADDLAIDEAAVSCG
jgi:hypothetical protein